MIHPYIVKLKSFYPRFEGINDDDVSELDKLSYAMYIELKECITKDSKTGEKMLKATLNSLFDEHGHLEATVNTQLGFLQSKGMDDYDPLFGNTKEVLMNFEDTIAHLLELLLEIFPESALKRKDIYKKHYPQLLNRIEGTKTTKPGSKRGPKTKKIDKWETLLLEKEKSKKVISAMKKYKAECANPEHQYIPVSILDALSQWGWIKVKDGMFAGAVRFISEQYGIHLDKSDGNPTRVENVNNSIKSEFLNILKNIVPESPD